MGVDKVFEFRHGFLQSMRWGGATGLTINVDTTTTVSWDPTVNVAALVQKILQIDSPNKIPCPLSQQQEQRVHKLRKLNFWVKYGNSSQGKIHSIDGIAKLSARTKVFSYTEKDTEQVVQITVEEYVHKCYNLRLKFPNLPLVQSKKCFFPMEVCYICPVKPPKTPLTVQNQRYTETLDPKSHAWLIETATHDPRTRRRNIETNVADIDWVSDQVLKDFEIEVAKSPVIATARVLSPPTLLFNKDVHIPKDGKWRADRVKFHEVTSNSIQFTNSHND